MPTVDQAEGRTPLGAALADFVQTLSMDQTIHFDLYVRMVMPLDGYVFWVRSDLVNQQAVIMAMQLDPAYLSSDGTLPAPSMDVKGSLHYATDNQQVEDSTYAVNRVVFTSLSEVENMNRVAPGLVYLATFDSIRFNFSSRGSWYQQADLWHYVGNAVYSVMESQIIDDSSHLPTSLIVSNSLPGWLALYGYAPVYPVPLAMPNIPLFPSFLVPDNLPPIYGSVHIEPEETRGLQGAPFLDVTSSQSSLAQDRVRITLYGVDNDTAQTFLYAILQYSLDTQAFGIMNTIPIVRDLKMTQNELSIIAQKKQISFLVSYTQNAIRNIARQMIQTAVPQYHPQPGPALPINYAPIGE